MSKKKLILPSKVRITSKISYEIVYCDDLGKDVVGECESFPNKVIRIKKGLSKKETLLVFIHELLHALSENKECGHLPHRIIYNLEKPIFNLLRLNKWIKLK